MQWRKYIAKRGAHKALSFLIVLTILVSDFGYGLILFAPPEEAEAAQVSIDTTAATTGTSHLQSGSQTVFIDDQTGYKFYRDSTGICVYSKTTNGGTSWGAAVTVDAQAGGNDCIAIQVWYDRWTPGDMGSYIHIVTMDTSLDDLFYNRLDTASSDTLLMGTSPTNMSAASGNSVASFTLGGNFPTITKGTDGTIYAAANDLSDSYIVECTTNCNLAASWIETTATPGVSPLDAASDYDILMPLAGGNIMVIDRDISLDDIRFKIWNNSSWSASWTAIDANAPENGTYDVGMAVAVSSTTPGTLYLAYIANNATLGTNDVIRTAKYNGSSWAATTGVITSTTMGLTNVAIGLNAANDDVYVAYSGQPTAGTTNPANVYWKMATSSMMNWSAQQGPVNSAAAVIYGVDLNIQSDQRIYSSWAINTTGVLNGDTIADIFPGIHASTSGTQTASVNASTSNFYVGGKFILYNTYKPIDVTGITITESGTIDGSNNISNVKLFYETDTSAPYDCASVSYNGTENQYGSTDTNGFSGANGVSSFTGTTVNVSTTSAMCVYVVMDVLDNTPSGSTIDISIADPVSDIIATGATGPTTAQNITGTTNALNDMPTQMHYHWRNDNGTEATATSKTGGVEDTPYTAFQPGTNARLRVEVSNEGGSSTPNMQYRLEYAELMTSCDVATGWIDVGAAGGVFDMFNTTNLTDGANTTNIANATGGVTDENTTFLTPNGGVKDTSSQTANILLSTTQYVELEYSISASSTAPEGTTYCFRVTNAGNPIYAYNQFPRTNIAADILVTASGTQTTSTNIPATNFYVGGKFVIFDNTGSHNVTGITIRENGTADGQNDLDNIKLYYELDTSAPYDCASESYAGTESQFGSTDTDGFSSANGTSTFSGSVTISTTATMCVYVVLDTTVTAQNGMTVDIILEDPSTNVVVSGGASVSPTVTRDITGVTTLNGPVLTQTHYHWRNDNGTEATATSMTGGLEDTPVSNIAQTTPVRLRLQVSNEGSVTSASLPYRIEFGTKITTCSAVSSWTDVGAPGGAWDMYNSVNLTDGNNTTDIAVATGGVTNENTTFLATNAGVKDTSSQVASTTLTSTQFIEMEFSMKQTTDAGYDTTYCFRVSNGIAALNAYTNYAELTTSPERDFEIQRGTTTFTTGATTAVITAGVNYTAPSASTSAFIRITNVAHTGAGHNTGNTAAQNAADVTVYITNPSNILNSITFIRSGTTNNTRVSWEIVEYIGAPGGDNEMIVRSQTFVPYTTTGLIATGTSVAVTDDTDVVVFITGQQNPLANSTAYNTGISTSNWNYPNNVPVFTRGAQSTNAVNTSYAVVEFTGPNWAIQRSEHTYTSAGTTETEPITAVNSLLRTFVHTQKRSGSGLNGQDEFGAEVWLSSIGYVSYFLEPGATTPSGQTSVAWIIENTQTTSGAMEVTRSNGSTNAGTAPLTVSVSIGKTLSDITNASIFVNARNAGTGTTYPRPMAGVTIASTTAYELWRSNTGSTLTYRTEIVEWPTAGLTFRQDYYRFYVDNNALTPTDPWPTGGADLGENTVLTAADEPLGEQETIRLRMSIRAINATFPAETKSWKLQYGHMLTTCSAITETNWNTLGNTSSSTIWRGANATNLADGTQLSGNPPTPGDLLLSVSDRAGTFEEINNTTVNMYAVPENEDIEYDWLIEQNGANAETYYCFRMVESDGTPLGGYTYYPQIRTASFTPTTQNWRWYSDYANVTPTAALANENTTPVNFGNGSTTKLRVTVKETQNISRDDVRFKIQYSEYADFSEVFDVVATSTCVATSTWCYADGGGVDNVKITTKVLSDAASCASGIGDGCGTHNEMPVVKTGMRHKANTATEYEFTIQSAAPRVNRVYYFRLYDMVQNIPVPTNTGESYPSLATEGAQIAFTMAGLTSGTTIEGVTLDINTTPTTLPFETLASGAVLEGAHRMLVDANGTEGYQLFMVMDGDLKTSGGSIIKPISGTNALPLGWASACDLAATSCFGYHTSDDTLYGGSTRFSAIDTYARVSTTTLDEVSYSSQPVAGDTTDVIFRILRRDLQDAGTYEARIRYISVPIF